MSSSFNDPSVGTNRAVSNLEDTHENVAKTLENEELVKMVFNATNSYEDFSEMIKGVSEYTKNKK